MARIIEHPDAKRLAWRIFLLQQANLFFSMPFTVYLVTLIGKISAQEIGAALWAVPPISLFVGIICPLYIVMTLTRKALATVEGESHEGRFKRLLELPRVIEALVIVSYTLGVTCYTVYLVVALNKHWTVIPWGTSVVVALALLVLIWTRLFIERAVMPYALEQFLKDPEVSPEGNWFYWPKQRWYLPYSFALFIICTILTMGTVIVSVATARYEQLLTQLDPAVVELLQQNVAGFVQAVWFPLTALGAFMLVGASLSALQLARHQSLGFKAIQESVEGFVNGRPKQPEWVTTDELGDLARITARAFNKVRDFSLSLRQTANTLANSAELLDESNTAQNQVITRQAAALQESQVTAQEIRQTSLLAAQKAESVLQQAQTVEHLRQESEVAVEQSITSLQEIREQVGEMASRIKALDAKARQIENITRTVKDLADQSNMLALNAAIEAVRSGEHGKGFGVVAREIRALADQSIKATNGVRQILHDISHAIRATVAMTEQGTMRVASSVEQVRAFGDNVRQLSTIMQENTLAVRQISAAVSQQNQGITQIFEAINDLNTIMTEAMERVGKTSTVIVDVRGVSTQVSQLITNYGFERTTWKESSSGKP